MRGGWRPFFWRKTGRSNGESFNFLNLIRNLDDVGWPGNGCAILWSYNLNYFDWLVSSEEQSAEAENNRLMFRWVNECTDLKTVGWDSYPTSLRIVNWIKWRLLGHHLSVDCAESLAVQARWLSSRVEWHILGNHLFANAKALIFSGAFFKGREADEWLRAGIKILEDELDEQVLSDGGHFERSPMYHAIFLEDLLDLINLGRAYQGIFNADLALRLELVAKRMLAWLGLMSHPDGNISFFNDCAQGVAANFAELSSYAAMLGLRDMDSSSLLPQRISHLRESGYIRVQSETAVGLLDVAQVGPDYLPGHAHADTLSFELSIYGRRVIVNCGTSDYSKGSVRHHERGTRAHSTVQISAENSSEVWGAFRVARRAYPQQLEISLSGECALISCAHDGYVRLKDGGIHRRNWNFSDRRISVEDWFDGVSDAAVARFHFHPDVSVSKRSQFTWLVQLRGFSEPIIFRVHSGIGSVEESEYAPEFGVRIPIDCLAVELEDGKASIEITWGVDHQ